MKINPFEGFQEGPDDTAANILRTIYNLGLGFEDIDELDAVDLIMELEDLFDEIEGRIRCLE